MIKIVVTGSIGMGKSTTAKMFVELGGGDFMLYDVDAVVHNLYIKNGAAVLPLAKIFPEAIKNGAVDRPTLSKLILRDPKKIKQVERIVHPLAASAQLDFLKKAEERHAKAVIFDIPLFFETGGDKKNWADYVVVVHLPENIQRQRVLERDSSAGEERFEAIKRQQMPSDKKCALADFVVETEHGLDYARKQVKTILEKIKLDASNSA